MLSSSRWIVLLVPLLAASGVAAQDAQRCEGTLCDFYYGGPPPEKPASGVAAAPTPLTAPKSLTAPTTAYLSDLFGGGAQPAAPAEAPGAPAVAPPKRPLVAVQGGGLVGRMNGEPASRCTGTLCDFYYGGPPPEAPEPQPAAMAPGEAPESTVDEPPPVPSRRRRAAEDAEARCASTPGDPWRCYR